MRRGLDAPGLPCASSGAGAGARSSWPCGPNMGLHGGLRSRHPASMPWISYPCPGGVVALWHCRRAMIAPPARLQKYLAQICRSHPRPWGNMRRRIDREETVIPHTPQLVLRLLRCLEKTFGQDVPLNILDPDCPHLIHADRYRHGLAPLPLVMHSDPAPMGGRVAKTRHSVGAATWVGRSGVHAR